MKESIEAARSPQNSFWTSVSEDRNDFVSLTGDRCWMWCDKEKKRGFQRHIGPSRLFGMFLVSSINNTYIMEFSTGTMVIIFYLWPRFRVLNRRRRNLRNLLQRFTLTLESPSWNTVCLPLLSGLCLDTVWLNQTCRAWPGRIPELLRPAHGIKHSFDLSIFICGALHQ